MPPHVEPLHEPTSNTESFMPPQVVPVQETSSSPELVPSPEISSIPRHAMVTRAQHNIVKPKQLYAGMVPYPPPKALMVTTVDCNNEPTSFTAATKIQK